MKLKIILLVTSLTTIVCQAANECRLLPEGFVLNQERLDRTHDIIRLEEKPGDIPLSSMCPRKKESLYEWLECIKSKRARLSKLFKGKPDYLRDQDDACRIILLRKLENNITDFIESLQREQKERQAKLQKELEEA